MEPRIICIITLISPSISEISKKEIEETVITLKKLKNWKIEKITLLEDQIDPE